MRIITIHEDLPGVIYGYERSQLCREQLLKDHNYQIVYYSLHHLNFDNYEKHMRSLGFHDFYHTVLDLSDRSRHKPSLRMDQIELLKQVKSVVYEGEFVSRINWIDGSYSLYTSGLFLTVTADTVTVYGSSFEKTVVRDTIDYVALIDYLKGSDLVLRDDPTPLHLTLRRFFTNTNHRLWQFVHYDTSSSYAVPFPKSPGKLVYTNLWLAELSNEMYLPPIYVNSSQTEGQGWCLVASDNPLKRVTALIKYWGEHVDQTLHVYGATAPLIYPNVIYHGNVKSIPYYKHKGYISNSITESFSNAMVEAMAAGLVCVVSEEAFAHRWHAANYDGAYLFKELSEINVLLRHEPVKGCVEFSEEQVKQYYESLL